MADKIPSLDLARFQTYFYKVTKSAFEDPDDKCLKIGINHTNQDTAPFGYGTKWEPQTIYDVWLIDLKYQIQRANLWLNGYDCEQRHFDAVVDLLQDDVFTHADYRPYTLIELIKYGTYDAAADQFLRWIVGLDGQITIKRIKRAFARRAYFKGLDYVPFTFAKVNPLTIERLNESIAPEGYKAVTNEKTGIELIRIVQ